MCEYEESAIFPLKKFEKFLKKKKGQKKEA